MSMSNYKSQRPPIYSIVLWVTTHNCSPSDSHFLLVQQHAVDLLDGHVRRLLGLKVHKPVALRHSIFIQNHLHSMCKIATQVVKAAFQTLNSLNPIVHFQLHHTTWCAEDHLCVQVLSEWDRGRWVDSLAGQHAHGSCWAWLQKALVGTRWGNPRLGCTNGFLKCYSHFVGVSFLTVKVVCGREC